MKTIFRKIGRALQWLFICKLLGLHEWTSKVQRNEPLPEPASKESIVEHMRTYCDICGAEAKFNEKFRKIFE